MSWAARDHLILDGFKRCFSLRVPVKYDRNIILEDQWYILLRNFGCTAENLPQIPGSSKQEWWFDTVTNGLDLSLFSSIFAMICLL